MRQTPSGEKVAGGGAGRRGMRRPAPEARSSSSRVAGLLFLSAALLGCLAYAGRAQNQEPRISRRGRPTSTPTPSKGKGSGTATADRSSGHRPKPTPAPPAVPLPPLTDYEFFTLKVGSAGAVTRGTVRRLRSNSYNEELGGSVSIEMVMLPAGSFMMGTSDAEASEVESEYARYCDGEDCRRTAARLVGAERPQHLVSVAAFGVGKWEVTQAQWNAVSRLPKVRSNLRPAPAGGSRPDDPMVRVSWHEAVEFCERLSKKTGRRYRLPTEAEWEYACRAQTSGDFAFGPTVNPDLVNYNGQYPYGESPKGIFRGAPRSVRVAAEKAANEFGLYDMHGNVSEWCLDSWHDDYRGASTQGAARDKGGRGSEQVARGGSWSDHAYACRSAFRHRRRADERSSTLGFRVVVVPTPAKPATLRKG